MTITSKSFTQDKICQYEYLEALYDFEGENQDDLSICSSDIIIVEEIDASGWWRGILGDDKGYFPTNFTKSADVVRYSEFEFHHNS
jgi:hypothetical protein